MKLLVSLFFIALIGFSVYSITSRLFKPKKQSKKIGRMPIFISAGVTILLLGLLGSLIYKSAKAPDTKCTTSHTTSLAVSHQLTSAKDYFLQGDYDYDSGNCQNAIKNYTKSLTINPNSPQAYNNRGYTYMRMRNYKAALPDLDKAIALNPNYIQPLMNRGDIHNYYYAIDRKSAIEDYQKVISLGGTRETSVCGHLFLAKHNGWNLGTFLSLPMELFSKCN